jgi:hypothetical protein
MRRLAATMLAAALLAVGCGGGSARPDRCVRLWHESQRWAQNYVAPFTTPATPQTIDGLARARLQFVATQAGISCRWR